MWGPTSVSLSPLSTFFFCFPSAPPLYLPRYVLEHERIVVPPRAVVHGYVQRLPPWNLRTVALEPGREVGKSGILQGWCDPFLIIPAREHNEYRCVLISEEDSRVLVCMKLSDCVCCVCVPQPIPSSSPSHTPYSSTTGVNKRSHHCRHRETYCLFRGST